MWLLSTGGLLYAMVDQGVTLTHQADEYERTREDLVVALALLPTLDGSPTRREVLEELRRQHPAALITATDSTVGIGGLRLRFGANGRLRGGDRLMD